MKIRYLDLRQVGARTCRPVSQERGREVAPKPLWLAWWRHWAERASNPRKLGERENRWCVIIWLDVDETKLGNPSFLLCLILPLILPFNYILCIHLYKNKENLIRLFHRSTRPNKKKQKTISFFQTNSIISATIFRWLPSQEVLLYKRSH